MIEINLLPDQMRKEKRLDLKLDLEMLGRVKFLAGGAVAGAMILLVLILFIGGAVMKKQMVGMILKEQAIASEKERAESANKDILFLMAKMGELDEITKRRFQWSMKLNQLSGLVLPGIWLTRIYTDPDGRLMLEGSVISKKEEAMATVGKFMKDIRENQAFFSDFTNIKLETVQRKGTGERDVVDFSIALYF